MCIKKLKRAAILALGLGMIVSGAQAESLKLKSKSVGPSKNHQSVSPVLTTKMADLIVMPFKKANGGKPNTGICGQYHPQLGFKNVTFRVKNIGSANAAKSVLYVAFWKWEQPNKWIGITKNIPSLAPGKNSIVTIQVPKSAQPNQYQYLSVQAVIDSYGQIPELSDNNNQVNETCSIL